MCYNAIKYTNWYKYFIVIDIRVLIDIKLLKVIYTIFGSSINT